MTIAVPSLWRRVALIAFMTVWPGLGWACVTSDCDVAIVDRDADGVNFQGMIHQQGVDAAEKILRPGDTLNMDSRGGDIDAAIRLGHLVRDRNIEVRAYGVCFSACAQYVWLPARTKSIWPYSTVMFDTPAAFILEVARRTSAAAAPETLEKAERRAAAERDLYAEAGIPPAFLQCFSDALRGDMGKLRSDSGEAAVQSFAAAMRAERVMFSQAALERLGVTGILSYRPEGNLSARIDDAQYWGYKIAWVRGTGACAAAPVYSPKPARR